MATSENTQRERLMAELEQAHHAVEVFLIPKILESMMSLRLTMQQVKILSILVVEPATGSIRQLADLTGVSLATMSGIVQRLEDHEMVERVTDPEDQRVRRVVATALGRQTIRKLISSNRELEYAQLEHLAIEDLAALVQGVRAVAQTLNAAD
ncbi:MAG TPA: MarR family transcriptional regulator [Candidatus Yaniella excrementigallinarum]|nr:MarR family transcriptional regulator [Candidatus Yaniella excrementigallinarum]